MDVEVLMKSITLNDAHNNGDSSRALLGGFEVLADGFRSIVEGSFAMLPIASCAL